MCFHSKQSKAAQALENRFKASIKTEDTSLVTNDHYNAFTHPHTPVIANSNVQEIQLFQWGLIPKWAKDKSIQAYTLNAKIETLCEKPSYNNIINNRCLILADGFIEWQWLDAKGKKKQPYLITIPNNELFAFAGIWSEWLDTQTGEILKTYSIVTTEANPLMAEIHNTKKRMPIILTPANETAWLNGTNYLDFGVCEIKLVAKQV